MWENCVKTYLLVNQFFTNFTVVFRGYALKNLKYVKNNPQPQTVYDKFCF
jgi:hypothetical protein